MNSNCVEGYASEIADREQELSQSITATSGGAENKGANQSLLFPRGFEDFAFWAVLELCASLFETFFFSFFLCLGLFWGSGEFGPRLAANVGQQGRLNL